MSVLLIATNVPSFLFNLSFLKILKLGGKNSELRRLGLSHDSVPMMMSGLTLSTISSIIDFLLAKL